MLPRIASRIFDTPLMIDAGKAAAIIAGIGGRFVDGGMLIEDGEQGSPVALRGSAAPRGVVASCGRLSHRKFLAPAASRNSTSFTRELITAVSVAATAAAVSPGVSTAP